MWRLIVGILLMLAGGFTVFLGFACVAMSGFAGRGMQEQAALKGIGIGAIGCVGIVAGGVILWRFWQRRCTATELPSSPSPRQ